MRKLFPLLAVVALASGLALLAQAAPPGKSTTLVGEGKCAKCALNETEACQNAIEVSEDGKTTTYYLTQNAVSKKFHGNICKAPKKIKVTGTVKDADDKKEITATKIELVKDEPKDDDADAPKPKVKPKKAPDDDTDKN